MALFHRLCWSPGNPAFNSEDIPIFLITVDGVHCRVNEPKHANQSKDPSYYSHKFKQSDLDYELGISVFDNALVWMNGPFKAGRHDMQIFHTESLKDIIPSFQWMYESLRVVLEPAMSLSMVESRTLSALMSDSDMGLRITKQCLRLFVSYVNISWRTDLLCSTHRCIWIIH
jgi:hypothetical protein